MVDALRNLYQSVDLPGDCFLQPLKIYSRFFAKKIDHCPVLEKIIWVVIHIATGIFLYPLFGFLALFGLLVKLTGIPQIKKHNRFSKTFINHMATSITYSESYATDSGNFVFPVHLSKQSGGRIGLINEFFITKQSIALDAEKMQSEVDAYSCQYRKLYIFSEGSIENGVGTITVQFRVREAIQH